MATGDIIGWLNSDDFYEENVFQTISMCFEQENTHWLVGNLKQVNYESGISINIPSPKVTYDALIKDPDIVRQPCTFFRKKILEQAGGWDKKLNMVMDFDLWLRMSKIGEPKMIDNYLANFVIHTGQKTNVDNIKRQAREIVRLLEKENVSKKVIFAILYKKYKSYFKQKLKSLLN